MSNIHVLPSTNKAGDLHGLADQIVRDLVKDEILEAFEYEFDAVPLDLLSGLEKPLGPMLEQEKRAFTAAMYLHDIIDDFTREKSAEVADQVGSIMRDKSVAPSHIHDRMAGIHFPKEDKELLERLLHSHHLLASIWSYSVKTRFNAWTRVGVRKNWIVVSFE